MVLLRTVMNPLKNVYLGDHLTLGDLSDRVGGVECTSWTFETYGWVQKTVKDPDQEAAECSAMNFSIYAVVLAVALLWRIGSRAD
jgi:hypothetical protein